MRKGILRNIIICTLVLVLLASIVALWQRQVHLRRAEEARAQAEAMAQPVATAPASPRPTPAPTPAPEPLPTPAPQATPEPSPWVWEDAPVEGDEVYDRLVAMDIGALQAENADVLGWIEIPGTDVAHPLVQGEDNAFYLDHTWQKHYSSAGSIFLEQYCSPALDDFNTIIYGHNMKNGSMFGTLRRYKTTEFAEENPYVYIVDTAGVHRYEVFAAYEAEVTSSTYRLALTEREEMESFLADSRERSVIDPGVTVGISDRVLTLSTCTGTGTYHSRWVVQAKLSPVHPNPAFQKE